MFFTKRLNSIDKIDSQLKVVAVINISAFNSDAQEKIIEKINELANSLVIKGARGYGKIVIHPWIFEMIHKDQKGKSFQFLEYFDIIPSFPNVEEFTVGVLNQKLAVNIRRDIRYKHIYVHVADYVARLTLAGKWKDLILD